jgi:hypothetical protein
MNARKKQARKDKKEKTFAGVKLPANAPCFGESTRYIVAETWSGVDACGASNVNVE